MAYFSLPVAFRGPFSVNCSRPLPVTVNLALYVTQIPTTRSVPHEARFEQDRRCPQLFIH